VGYPKKGCPVLRAKDREVRLCRVLASYVGCGDALPCGGGFRTWVPLMAYPANEREVSHRSDFTGHIREQYLLSLASCGRPLMTMEIKEAHLDVGKRRVGRLMRINGIKPIRTRRDKVTIKSNHQLGIAPNLLGLRFITSMQLAP
jgi:putative transposase